MPGLWHLHDVDWFEEMSESDMARVEAAVEVQRFEAARTVFRPDAEPRFVYLLKSGMIRIYRLSAEGQEATIGYVRPGEVFGELSAVTGGDRESYAEAVVESVAWRLSVGLFRELLGSRPGVGRSVARQLGQRLERIESRFAGLMFDDAHQRLTNILRELAEHFGVHKGESIEIDGDFTQAELATLVGCSRQTLNQCLRDLGESGLVEMKRRRIVLPKPAQLRVAAGK